MLELYKAGAGSTSYSIGTSNTLDSTTKLVIQNDGNVGIGTTGRQSWMYRAQTTQME